MNHIREELAAVLREIHLAENSHYRQDADALLASPVIRNIQESAWLKGYAAGREPQGEPSDAIVLAALNAEDNIRAVQGGYKPRAVPETLSTWKAHDIERMRGAVCAALRAAGGVR